METLERRLPMRKPPNHKPAVQRYSVRFPEGVREVVCAYIGIQGVDAAGAAGTDFCARLSQALPAADGPDAFDWADYVDTAGVANTFCVAYWLDPSRHDRWVAGSAFGAWWQMPAREAEATGYWMEIHRVPLDRMETIAFREYPGGIARCPDGAMTAMSESGYFGAMRDRIPLAAYDTMDSPLGTAVPTPQARATRGARWRVQVPENLVCIRSGVSWEKCQAEQRAAYDNVMRPTLDRGMENLRAQGLETGCFTLRQVQLVELAGARLPQAYSQGYFQSLQHLEKWCHYHPTHLAIYKQAMADRKHYAERLELRTYHEVFVLPRTGQHFEYVNCHPATGLAAFFEATEGR